MKPVFVLLIKKVPETYKEKLKDFFNEMTDEEKKTRAL